ncbi:TPA: phage tail protein [Streptococcus suis]|nr:phage tail protein [Streptococcus suis]
MILTIHDNNLQKVAFIDNNKQGTLNFYNDKWTRYLSKASSLFEFTVFKQTIQTDVAPYQTANALNDRSFVSFVYKGRTYLFNVMTIEETEHTITCTCKDLNLELTNEYTNPFKSDKARTFKEYCDVMGLLEFAVLRIGVNEISDQRRTLEWTGQDTKLNRILSLANKFDAEVDFEVRLNSNGTIKDFILNVYHEHDDKHQGVGKVRSDIILKKGENIRSIKRKIDKTDLIVNAVRPTAQGENGQEITIAGLGPWEVKNENGVVEFFQQGEMLYAPISMQKYPSVWTGSTGNRDKYTRKDITVDTKSKEMLRTQAYKELMRSAYPSVTYEIDGYVDLEIGDTAKVYNGDFYPALLLEVRVSEQTISFTKPSTNKTVFDNVRALKNKLSNGIQERWQELFEASQPYLIKLATDNGVIFKNGAGQSIVTPILYKGGRPITANVTWRWSLDGAVKTGMTYSVRGADVTDTSTLTVAAYIGNDEVAVDELTFVNVLDGRDGGVGPKGDPGNDGVAGRDGQTPVVHWAYSDNADGTGLTTSDNGQRYIGHYSDYTQADSTDKTKYRWADRWAKIEVGGRNLFKGSRDFSGVWFNNGNGVFFEEYKGVHIHRTKTAWLGKSQRISVKSGEIYTFSFYAKSDSENDAVMFYLSHSATGTPAQGHPNNKNIGISTDYQRYSITIKIASDGIIIPRLERTNTTSFLFFGGFKLETGTLATDWSPAPEDLRNQLNSKADQALTQEQLNSLNERAGIIQAELEAKASLDTVNNILKQIKDMKAADEATWAKVEKDLITHLQRVIKIETNLGDQAQRWNAVDTFMQVSNEGLSLGKADGSSSMLFSPDGRITMFSSGTPVMYVDKGVIHIDNGIFSKTVQIGLFREEQYHNNPYINVKRCVG